MPVTKIESNQQLEISGNLDFANTYKGVNHINPTAPQDVATKAYVDAHSGGSGGGTNSNVTIDCGSFISENLLIDCGTF